MSFSHAQPKSCPYASRHTHRLAGFGSKTFVQKTTRVYVVFYLKRKIKMSDEGADTLFQDVLKRTMDALKEQKVLIDHDRSRQVMNDFICHQSILRAVMTRADAPGILRDMLVEDLAQNSRDVSLALRAKEYLGGDVQ
jgi:hypothetical protein